MEAVDQSNVLRGRRWRGASGKDTCDGGNRIKARNRPFKLSVERNRAAACASAVTRAKSPAAIASGGATHEPPTAITLGSAR